MNTIAALIFDVDGTLADTEREGHLPAFNTTFREHGLSWHWSPELYGELLAVTGGKERMRFYAENYDPGFLARPDAEILIRQMHQAKNRHYVALMTSGAIQLRAGVLGLIRLAKASGIRLAIATTTSPENVDALLAATLPPDLQACFEVIGAGDVVTAKKPAPDIYQWVLAQLGLDAGVCLAVEDSENGLRASLGAGLKTVVTLNDYTRGQDFSGAAWVLDSLTEMPAAKLLNYSLSKNKKA
jgi:HAD superfamily hydrolase (TIGR01509 family)